MMKSKILIYAVYPAPYRVDVIKEISDRYVTDVIFGSCTGDDRNAMWFSKGSYYSLDNSDGRVFCKKCIRSLSDYSLVIIYDYSEKTAAELIIGCRLKKVRYIINCDGVMLTPHGNAFKDIAKRFLIRGASAYFASGDHAAEYFLGYGADGRLIHRHNFSTLHKNDILRRELTADEKMSLRKEHGLPADKKIALAVGRFIPLKRYDVLIRLWENMTDEYCLLLIGGGPEKDSYEKYISENVITNVIIEDFHRPEELYEFYRASDIFVHPTSYDVWGLVINEAMANGLPVISTDKCVAALELIRQGVNGYVVPLGDDADMTDKAAELLKNDILRASMVKECIKTVESYTVENMADSQLRVINMLIGKGKETKPGLTVK